MHPSVLSSSRPQEVGNQETNLTPLYLAGALGSEVPHIINTKLLKHFTCLTYNNGRSIALIWGSST